MSDPVLAAFAPGISLFKVTFEVTVDTTDVRYMLAESFKEVELYFEPYFNVTLENLLTIERISDIVHFPSEWEIPNKVLVSGIYG